MEVKLSDYKTIGETAREWNISTRMVLRYCNGGRIPGAVQISRIWFIPRDAQKPTDRRVNNRRRPKKEESAHGTI
jgi:hypothetical protein